MKTLLTALLALSLVAPVFGAAEWHIEVVDSGSTGGQTGLYPSLVLDGHTNAHISYFDGSFGFLEYATNPTDSWQLETVASGFSSHGTTSIGLDSAQKPHIVCSINLDTGGLYHFSNDGSTWQQYEVDVDGGAWCSMAMDSSDRIHISYVHDSYDGLRYAVYDGSSWSSQIVDSTSGTGMYHHGIAVDSSNNPHIAYTAYTGFENNLRYSYFDGTHWNTEELATIQGIMSSIAIDSNDLPHISSWIEKSTGNVAYLYNDGSDWYFNSPGITGGYITSIALDSADRPHIAFNSGNDLYYAYWTGSTWETEEIDTNLAYGVYIYCSIAVDEYNNPHIAYWDSPDNQLKYAWYGDKAGVDDLSLSAEPTDDGVLLSWSILGDEPASVSVLRSVSENQPIALSGELSGSATNWLDVSAEAGVEYAYYLEVTEIDGTVSRFGPSEVIVPGTVSELTLSDPYPNPADESLTIHYELTQNATVKLHIYDVAGRLVETLVSGEQTAGRHSVIWDSSASTMATGVYLIRLETNGEAITKRAVISR